MWMQSKTKNKWNKKYIFLKKMIGAVLLMWLHGLFVIRCVKWLPGITFKLYSLNTWMCTWICFNACNLLWFYFKETTFVSGYFVQTHVGIKVKKKETNILTGLTSYAQFVQHDEHTMSVILYPNLPTIKDWLQMTKNSKNPNSAYFFSKK